MGEPCIFFGTMFLWQLVFLWHGFIFCVAFFPLSLPCFNKQACVEKAAWGVVLGVGHVAGT